MRRLDSIIITVVLASVTWASASEHAAEAEVGLFSGTFADALWTVISFVVLLAVLRKYAWGPLLKTLNARQEQIEQQLNTAQESRKRANELLDEYRQQGETLLQDAAAQAHTRQKQSHDKMQQEIAALRRSATEDIENAKAAAMDQLWHEAGDMVAKLGTQVLERTVNKEDNQQLITKAISEMREGGAHSA
jgi:F-type H+-transporting ATPase subunit b